MSTVALKGYFLQAAHGFNFGDSSSVTWAFDQTTNTLSATASAGGVSGLAEAIDDEVAALIQNGTGISWTYNDGAGTLTPAVTLSPFTTANLTEGANLYFTDERAQDAIGTILSDTSSIDFTYNDGAPSISAVLKDTAVSPGAYTNANITIDQQGRITSAANGSTGVSLAGANTWTNTNTFKGPNDAQLLLDSAGGDNFTSAYWQHNGVGGGGIWYDNAADSFNISALTGGTGVLNFLNGGNVSLSLASSGAAVFRTTIKTVQPSANGAGVWKLGKTTAAVVVLDTANYVEVDIDGAIVKLGIVL